MTELCDLYPIGSIVLISAPAPAVGVYQGHCPHREDGLRHAVRLPNKRMRYLRASRLSRPGYWRREIALLRVWDYARTFEEVAA